MNRTLKRFSAQTFFSSLILGITLLAMWASAATDTYTGPTGGGWNTAADWTSGANHLVPANGDDAVLGTASAGTSSVTVSFNINYIAPGLNSLTLDASGITGNITLNQTTSTSMIAATETVGKTVTRAIYNQSAGSNVVGAGGLDLGLGSGSSGTYNFSAANGASVLSVNGPEMIGDAGTGTFNQSGGTHHVTASSMMGNQASGSAMYSITGGTFIVDQTLTIANQGSATFTQSSGALDVSGTLIVANFMNSVGTYNLSGPSTGTGAATISAASEVVGGAGNATFNQTGGSHSIINMLSIGPNSPSATYNLHAGVVNAGSEFVGNARGGVGSEQAQFVQTGGSNSIAGGALVIGANPASSASYTMDNSNGPSTLNAPTVAVGQGGPGSFTQNAGSVTISSTLVVGALALTNPGKGTYTLNGGTLIANTSNASVPEDIGFLASTGTFNQTGGSNQVTGDVRLGSFMGSAGTYNLNAGTFTITGNINIGHAGTGTFNHNGGSLSVSGGLLVGSNANSSGTYMLSGAPTAALSAANEFIGNSGSGVFNHQGGSNTISGAFEVGVNAGASATYNLSGGKLMAASEGVGVSNGAADTAVFAQTGGTNTVTGSGQELALGQHVGGNGKYTLDSSAGASTLSAPEVVVGELGSGTFNQSGGAVAAANLTIGHSAGSTGSYSLSGPSSGPGASTITAVSENVGQSGSGTFTQSGGSQSATFLTVGANGGSSGTFKLSGGTLAASAELIGDHNSATDTAVFVQTGGSHAISGASGLTLGLAAGSNGNYTMDDSAGASILSVINLTIGSSGVGAFTQSGGTTTVEPTLVLGRNAGAMGTYTLSGSASLTATSSNSSVPEQIGSSGVGIFNQMGGSNTVNGDVRIAAGSGTGTYNLSGGIFTVSGNIGVGHAGAGSLNQTGGTASVTLGLFVGSAAGSIGTYSLGGASTGPNSVTLATGFESVGNFGQGTFNQSGGSNSITGTLSVGVNGGSSGTFNLSAGALSAGSEVVGAGNGAGDTALFAQTGGTNTMAGLLVVGQSAGAGGTYSLSASNGVGTLTVNNNEDIGFAGRGTFTQSGGTHHVTAALFLGSQPGSAGSYVLSGGTLTVDQQLIVGGSGAGNLTQTGGTLAPAGLELGLASGSTGTLGLMAGTINAGFEFIGFDGNGTFNQTGGSNTSTQIVIQAGAGSGAYTLTGATLTANGMGLLNHGTFNLVGGNITGSGPLTNSGLMSGFGTIAGSGGFINNLLFNQGPGTVTLSNTGTNTNAGTMNLSGGQSFVLGGVTLGNGGVLNVNGAQITGSGTLANQAGGTISGSGTIGNSVLRNAAGASIVPAGGVLNVVNPFTNGGQINVALGAALAGAAVVNTGTVQGAGVVNNPLNNMGGTVEPVGGTLTLTGQVTNAPGGILTSVAGNKLLITQGLSTNSGTIALAGGVIENNNNPLSNAGTIQGYGVLRTGALSNNGSITFAGGSATLDGDLTNSAGATVAITNTPALFTGNVINSGTIKTTKTTLTILGTYTGQAGGTFNSDPADNYFQGSVSLQSGASIVGGPGNRFLLSGGTFSSSGTWNVGGTLQTSDPISNAGTFVQSGPLSSTSSFVNSGAAQISGGQTWGPRTTYTNTSGTTDIASDAGGGGANLSVSVTGGKVTLGANQNLAALSISTGELDVRTSTVTVHYAAGADPNAAIAAAVLVGKMTGSGIVSSTAAANEVVGYVDNTSMQTETVKVVLFGDINLDGKVNNSDFFQFNKSFGKSSGQAGFNPQFDFNNDGKVNNTDYFQFNRNFGKSITTAALPGLASDVPSVPEPAALTLFAIGAAIISRPRP